jgi:hypothetical protein
MSLASILEESNQALYMYENAKDFVSCIEWELAAKQGFPAEA